jgi:hypothetical protein
MFTNNVKFNPFRLCIHNFQYMSIRFQVFKFDIDVVLFSSGSSAPKPDKY